MNLGITVLIISCLSFEHNSLFAQKESKNILNYGKIYGLALNQDIQQVLKILDTAATINETDKKFKASFENRFKYATDKSDYFIKKDTTLNPLQRLYQDYWRKSLLDNSKNYDEYFAGRIITFLTSENQKSKFTGVDISVDTLDDVWKNYIESKGYHGVNGKTGSLYDFLVWKTETDTVYNIKLINDTVNVNVHFMDDFISKGWEEYATLGRYYPGGWSSSTSLSCVKKSYNLKSENFFVSYLSHEGQHFSDLKHFPKLSSPDLEYRAKLIELSFSDKELYSILNDFILNAKYDRNNGHPFADFCIIRNLSRLFFKNDFENDINKWKQIPKSDINNAAKNLFLKNSAALKEKGSSVQNFIE